MSAPFLANLDVLRKLGGEPLVTWPFTDSAYPVTERVRTAVPRLRAFLAFNSPEPDTTRFPGLVLTEQHETGGNRHFVEMGYHYEKIPQPWQDTTRKDPDGVTVKVRRRRNYAADIVTAESVADGVQATATATLFFSGSGASAGVTVVDGAVTDIFVITQGAGYDTVPPLVTITDPGGGTGATAVANISSSGVTSYTVTAGGSGYGGGFASVTLTPQDGSVASASVISGGNAYQDDAPPLVTITGDGTGATATANVVNGSVTAITVTSGGLANYTTATVMIAPPVLRMWTRTLEESDGPSTLFATEVQESRTVPGNVMPQSSYDPRTAKPTLTTKQIVARSDMPTTAALLNNEINSYASKVVTGMAGGGVILVTAHGYQVGDEIFFTQGTSPPVGFIAGDRSGLGAYFVHSVATDAFTFSLKVGGPAISGASGLVGYVSKRLRQRGTIIEYKEMDGQRLVRLVTTVDNSEIDYLRGAPDKVTYGKHVYGWPDTLVKFRFIFAEASIGGDLTGDVALDVKIVKGYNGKSEARFTERYTYNPSAPGFLAGLPPIWRFLEDAVSLPAAYAYFDSSSRAHTGARTFTIPATIHRAMSAGDVDGNIGSDAIYSGLNGFILSDISATNPSAIPFGEWIVVDIIPEELGNGFWKYRIIEVMYPNANA